MIIYICTYIYNHLSHAREGSAFTPKQLGGMAHPTMGTSEVSITTSKQVKDIEHPNIGVEEDEASRRVSDAVLLGVGTSE